MNQDDHNQGQDEHQENNYYNQNHSQDYQGGYYDNQGRYVPPGHQSKGWLMVCIGNALAMVVTEKLISGIQFSSFFSVLLAALLFSLISYSIKPLVHVLALPVTILTFGLFGLVINGLMLELVDFFIAGLTIESFGSAVLGSIVITLCNVVLSWLFDRN